MAKTVSKGTKKGPTKKSAPRPKKTPQPVMVGIRFLKNWQCELNGKRFDQSIDDEIQCSEWEAGKLEAVGAAERI